jgi:hypothetical protein
VSITAHRALFSPLYQTGFNVLQVTLGKIEWFVVHIGSNSNVARVLSVPISCESFSITSLFIAICINGNRAYKDTEHSCQILRDSLAFKIRFKTSSLQKTNQGATKPLNFAFIESKSVATFHLPPLSCGTDLTFICREL